MNNHGAVQTFASDSSTPTPRGGTFRARLRRSGARFRGVPRAVVWAALAAFAAGFASGAPSGAEVSVHNQRFVFSTEEKLDFDLEAFLRDSAPHLLPYRDTIAHWSAHATVSPKITLTLIEIQSRLVSESPAGGDAFLRPLGTLSEEVGFADQLRTALHDLSVAYYEARAAAESGDALERAASETLARVLRGTAAAGDSDEARTRAFQRTYARLFRDAPPLSEALGGASRSPTGAGAVPPGDFMDLPYPLGDTWVSGGTHTFTGSDPGPMSSLDLHSDSFPSWGDDTSNDWVVAAHPGTVRVYSSCFLEIIDGNGFSTSYYHLDNIIVADHQVVGRGQPVANYADNEAQAICQGGFSTGPHVHFSLLRNGQYIPLHDNFVSGFRVDEGRFSYDSDCNHYWLERDGLRHCAWVPLFNDGGMSFPLATATTGNGGGTITSAPSGIDCGGDCNATYYYGTEVTLTATADSGSDFTGWSGSGCSGAGACVVSMTEARSVTAAFTVASHALSVTMSGSGSGAVTSVPAGILCGSACAEIYPAGTEVTLSASPGIGSRFAGWRGDGDCADGVVRMNAAKTCTADFDVASSCEGTLAVGILDSAVNPSYFVGTNNNVWESYRGVLDADPEGRFSTSVLTSLDVGSLAGIDVLVLPDNAVADDDLNDVDTWFQPGRSIVAVDSAVGYAAYSGYLWPAAAGTNGATAYWDYSSLSNDQEILRDDYVTRGYAVGQVIASLSGDAQVVTSLVPADAVVVTGSSTDPSYRYVVYRDVPGKGRFILLGPYAPIASSQLHALIRDAAFSTRAAECIDEVFRDGFETNDVGNWSSTSP